MGAVPTGARTDDVKLRSLAKPSIISVLSMTTLDDCCACLDGIRHVQEDQKVYMIMQTLSPADITLVALS